MLNEKEMVIDIKEEVIEDIVNIDQKLPANKKLFEVRKIFKKHHDISDENLILNSIISNQSILFYLDQDLLEYILNRMKYFADFSKKAQEISKYILENSNE